MFELSKKYTLFFVKTLLPDKINQTQSDTGAVVIIEKSPNCIGNITSIWKKGNSAHQA